MNHNIIRDVINLKMEIIDEVSRRLPAGAKEKIERLEYDFMAALSEVSKEYLEKTKRPEEKQEMKKVTID
jgi:hypothetical protein